MFTCLEVLIEVFYIETVGEPDSSIQYVRIDLIISLITRSLS